ncbi:hypothetical protein N185_17345 [Sinorhizobium sp. GW3]|nr:hypothetical protein N185_17345 [Sinorhizobium sp. GW3]
MTAYKHLTYPPLACIVGALALVLGMSSPARADEEVVIASTGGAYDKALREAWFDPFTKETGIAVKTVAATNAEMRAKASAMVKTGNVSWDLYMQGEIQAMSPQHLETAQDISQFCRDFDGREDLVADACLAGGIRLQSTATLLVYDRSDPKAPAPETWADMWDTKRFPGGRAFPNFDDPWRVMAAALLADGVPRDKLFPLDVDRALAKLEEIRPAVSLWWKTGDQSVQGFRNKDYTLGQIWLTRATALKAEGYPIAWSYKAAFLVGDRVALVKDAPNRENALKLMAYWLNNPKAQARACELLSCTPPSSQAIEMMSPEARAGMPSSNDIEEHIIVPDAVWINANASRLLERWNAWVR